MEYKIKQYSKKYLRSCAELVKSTWNFHSDFEEIPAILPIYIVYVKECLDFSIHREIIVDENDKVCGLLFGSIEDGSFLQNIKCRFNSITTFLYTVRLWIFGKFGKKDTAKKIAIAHMQVDKLGEEQSDLFDGEVNLFIVSKALRGKKYGYKLMNNYVDFCKQNNLKNIFLWTELSCSYTFYERYGFERYNTFYDENLTDGDKQIDNGFVYSYKIN